MAENRPFAVEQADGLRRMFAGNVKRAFVVGFIASSRDARVGTAMELLAVRLRRAGKSVLLVDEQAKPKLQGTAVLHRPAGVGEKLDEHRLQYDFIFVDAYPSRDSFIHSADMFTVTAPAPEFDTDNIRLLLKAISKAPQGIGLILTCTGDSLRSVAARKQIEDVAQRDFKRDLQWVGAIPVDQPDDAIAACLDGCVERLERIRTNKENADV
jgi:hypothetical protein